MAKLNASGTVTLVQGVGHGTSRGNGGGSQIRKAPLAISGGGGGLRSIPNKNKAVPK